MSVPSVSAGWCFALVLALWSPLLFIWFKKRRQVDSRRGMSGANSSSMVNHGFRVAEDAFGQTKEYQASCAKEPEKEELLHYSQEETFKGLDIAPSDDSIQYTTVTLADETLIAGWNTPGACAVKSTEDFELFNNFCTDELNNNEDYLTFEDYVDGSAVTTRGPNSTSDDMTILFPGPTVSIQMPSAPEETYEEFPSVYP